jgi:hypothetical protein
MTSSEGSLTSLGIRCSVQAAHRIDALRLTSFRQHRLARVEAARLTVWAKVPSGRNDNATTSLTRWTTARRLSTAPVADSQRLEGPLFKNMRFARIAKGGGPVPGGERTSLKKPAKTREELEAAIRLEMEDICELPTDIAISVVPSQDTWKVAIMTDGQLDAGRVEMIETIADRLRTEFDLKS